MPSTQIDVVGKIEAGEIMTSQPLAIEVTCTINEAIDQMYEADVRHLPVVKEGVLVGMISDRDVRSYLPAKESMLEDSENEDVIEQLRVGEIVQTDVVFVSASTKAAEVVDLMLDHKIGAVPIVEPANNKLIGIVSYEDILRTARELL